MSEEWEFGAGLQVAGYSVSGGISNEEGLVVTFAAQGSVVVAGAVTASFSIDPRDFDIFDGDPTDDFIDTNFGTYVGVGTPTGLPGPSVVLMTDPRSGMEVAQLGIGVTASVGWAVCPPSFTLLSRWWANCPPYGGIAGLLLSVGRGSALT